MSRLPKQTIDNLNKIADFLETAVKDEQFNISVWRGNGLGESTSFRSLHACGTVGCAIGWAPFIEGLEPLASEYVESVFLGETYLNFEEYRERILECVRGETFDHVFGPDNALDPVRKTREHTIKRIRDFALLADRIY